ncbi:sigma-G-dependent sporulation-specific acid-soluble spore protein CsgA [Sutcliffiella deserti]|uniref:sigma-G-dependent sporulation-specific acid-soluble spore protein CsgA n=1 Tax=Sutcliffiella deserti TaxID=2875501 RepID=UPI001CBEEF8C|nr:sigma-G-dependent sporulation-specific acid-soluble spore protein CsgA [Sutcliffiella deserti]
MNKALGYLQEVLSSYPDDQNLNRQIVHRIKHYSEDNLTAFIYSLSEEEVQFLNESLPDEMKHALQSEDFLRLQQLNEVYELL